ncbi:MAG TPA: COX15/CtaA family protein, partial [bacterium]
PVVIHFLHRTGAFVTTCAVVWTLWRGHQDHRGEAVLRAPAMALLAFLAVQVTLGAGVIWSQRELVVTTAHLVNGALLLGSATLLTLRAWVIEAGAR